nr:MAG TPA: hypothetical protein [Caudoviricetes sp.]DAI80099.1 MAG TPA: hypothetical protein [Caudoviricetes sp.]
MHCQWFCTNFFEFSLKVLHHSFLCAIISAKVVI